MDTLDKFRNGEIMLLAASDVAARGLDIPDVSHVFNFDLPWAADDYVHRIGRTGRAGREGYSASLVSPDDLKFVADIEKITGESAVWLGDPPSEEDIAGAGKRRRGRGGRGAAHSKSARPRSGGGEKRTHESKANGTSTPHRRAKDDPASSEQPAAPRQQRPKRERTERARHADQQPQPGSPPPRSKPRADNWTDEPKAKAPQSERPESRKPQQREERLGFAENVPAFMRRPSRPAKVPGRS
jgi:superfamily II DNA/RNA helicase